MNNLENLINKKVLITGNTGFKGAWLSILLDELGADVYGLADKIPWENGIFSKKSISKVVNQSWIDILDYQKVQKLIKKIKPDFVFHLAAQPLVLESHISPRETFLTNINGTVNILESIRKINPSIPLIIITSDKVYKNDEKGIFFDESNELKGKDPYSASKSCAEIVAYSYQESFSEMRIATARSGNVIGGGDWSNFRIIPDVIKSIIQNKKPILRNPTSTRPWLYVLDVCKGYVDIAVKLNQQNKSSILNYNLAPTFQKVVNVKELTQKLIYQFGRKEIEIKNSVCQKKESKILNLNCKRAIKELGWKNYFGMNEAISETAKWYKTTVEENNPYDITKYQVKKFLDQIFGQEPLKKIKIKN